MIARKDLSTASLLGTVAVYGQGGACPSLHAAGFPGKVIEAAILRDVRAGLLEYGVSSRFPWLTEAGWATIGGREAWGRVT